MTRFILSRLFWAIPIIILILVVNFLLVHLAPGDPVQALVGDFPAPQSYIDQIRHEFGLDQSIWVQLWRYFENLARGNLGYSFANRQPVLSLLLARTGATLILMIPALTVASVLGVFLALLAAPRSGSVFDSGITALSLFGYSVPIFWLGQLFIILFSIHLGWLPAQGMISLRASGAGWGYARDLIWHMILPVFSITIFFIAIVARVARASVVGVLSEDFITTALAKGMSRRTVLWRHVLPNAMIPVVTVIGYNFGYSLTGAILVETVFAWPGLGNLFITSVGNRDYPVLQGILLFSAIMVVIANLATDFMYVVLDPRVRRATERKVREFWSKFAAHRFGVAGLVFIIALIVLAVVYPLVSPYDPAAISNDIMLGPSAKHWFGTDDLGRDVFAGMCQGIQVSLTVGFAAALASSVLGILIGSVAGFVGGRTDLGLMRFSEMFQVMPSFILAAVIVAIAGPGLARVVGVIAILAWPQVARVIRGEVLRIRQLEFVDAVRCLGFREGTILFQEIIPNALPPVLAVGTLIVGQAILLEASLSFLGLSSADLISWGRMLNNGQRFLFNAWWLSFFPGAAIFLTVLAFNLIGDAVGAVLNPKGEQK